MSDIDKTSIADLTKEAAAALTSLVDSVKAENGDVSFSLLEVTDATERFKLWAGNIGAAILAEKSISLESRLEDAPEIKEQICSLLQNLIEAINDLNYIRKGERSNRTSAPIRVDYDDTDGEAHSSFVIPCVDEANDLVSVIANCTRNLMRLSIIIRKASPRDRFSIAQQKTSYRFMGQFDIRHVAEKFPKLDTKGNEWLKRRIGRAITQRRQFLSYSRHHRETQDWEDVNTFTVKAMMNAEKPVAVESHNTLTVSMGKSQGATQTVQASTKASTLVVPLLEAASAEDEDDGRSYTSVATSLEPSEESTLQLPSLQEVSKGQEEFECPLCCGIQSFRLETAWKRHAFSDLKAYVCCFSKTECELELFSDRNSWFSHELQQHRHQWSCFLCQREPFRSYDRFETHLKSRHIDIPREQFPHVAQICQQPLSLIPALDCPFCDEWETRLRAAQVTAEQYKSGKCTASEDIILVEQTHFRRHVAAHMEQLALFAIPRNHTIDDTGQDSTVNPNSVSHDRGYGSETEEEHGMTDWPSDPPLHLAASRGDFQEVLRLLDEGADINAKGETWGSAIDAAEASYLTSIVILLRKRMQQAQKAEEENTSGPSVPNPLEPDTMGASYACDSCERMGYRYGWLQVPGGYQCTICGSRRYTLSRNSQDDFIIRPGAPPPEHESLGGSDTAKTADTRLQVADINDLDEIWPIFKAADKKGDGKLDGEQLQLALSSTELGPFDAQMVSMMIKMFDRSGSESITLDEFCGLLGFLRAWRNLYDHFVDPKKSEPNFMNLSQFQGALLRFGYRLSSKFSELLYRTYFREKASDITEEMHFGSFVASCIMLKRSTDIFKKFDDDRDGYITLSFEDMWTEVLPFIADEMASPQKPGDERISN